MSAELALVILGALVIAVWLVLARANRIDLLHQKVTRAGATLDAQLLRRAGLATELAASGALDPASALIVADTAGACLEEAREADLEAVTSDQSRQPGRVTLTPEREVAESELSRALRFALETDDGDATDPVRADVLESWRRAQMARRFYNEAVAQVVRLRSKPTVRLLHLAGRAAMPRTFEMDDAMPDTRAGR